jgi:hypothetical protein
VLKRRHSWRSHGSGDIATIDVEYRQFGYRIVPHAEEAVTLGAHSRTVLRSVNWFWPAYMRRGYVVDLITRLETRPEGPERTAEFESALAPMYSPGHLAAMLLDRYAHVPMVSPFRRHIGEAIEAAYLGLFHAAVATMIPTIEGIVRAHATDAGRDLGNAGRAQLGTEIEQMVAIERQAHPGCTASDERVEMIEMFGEFLRDSLYMHTRSFTGNRELNRHGAVHGIYRDYGSAANFYVLVSVLDLLTFVLTFRTSGISMLAPDVSAQARRLAAAVGRVGVDLIIGDHELSTRWRRVADIGQAPRARRRARRGGAAIAGSAGTARCAHWGGPRAKLAALELGAIHQAPGGLRLDEHRGMSEQRDLHRATRYAHGPAGGAASVGRHSCAPAARRCRGLAPAVFRGIRLGEVHVA